MQENYNLDIDQALQSISEETFIQRMMLNPFQKMGKQ
jgi:hypothetical protein